jgi:L-asparaginase
MVSQGSSKLPKILILDTGGTISQKPGRDGSLVPCTTDYIEMVPRLHDIARIELVRLERMDSTDMSTALRGRIASRIAGEYGNYDGFVVLHGTDTMADTAAALTYMLNGLGKPVVITGAQLPIFAPGPDGMNNLFYSVKVAGMDLGEVVICFGDRILRGCRSSKENVNGFNAFGSHRVPPLGELGVSVRLLNHRIPRSTSHPQLFTAFDSGVCYLPMSSGSTLKMLESLAEWEDLKGLVIGGFGTGNIPSIQMDGLKRILKRGIPVVVVTTCLQGDTILEQYEVGQVVKKAGAVEGMDLTPICAVQKLMYAVGLVDSENQNESDLEKRRQKIYEIFQTPVALDMTPPTAL